jgi:hypothetical protein
MASIVLRSVKGSPLTIAEADANIQNINIELGGKLDIATYTASDVLAKLLTVDGLNSGLDADRIQGKNIASTNTINTLVLRDNSGNFSATTVTANLVGNVTGNITGNGQGTWTGSATNVSGVVTIDHGGTGATSVSAARTALELGTLALQDSNNVNIGGGTITGINPLAILVGGTGANNATAARVNLGLNIGTDVQGFDPILSNISALGTNGFIVKTGSGLVSTRNFVAGSNISITNNDGISGNPTVALISSPALTGTPTAPTATAGTSTTQLATTAFVTNAVTTGDTAQQVYTDNRFNSIVGIAKAWAVFDGNTGTILASNNVTSVSANGAGQYTINISVGTFSNANFVAFGLATGNRFVTFVNSSANALVINTMLPTFNAATPQVNNGVVRVAMFN